MKRPAVGSTWLVILLGACSAADEAEAGTHETSGATTQGPDAPSRATWNPPAHSDETTSSSVEAETSSSVEAETSSSVEAETSSDEAGSPGGTAPTHETGSAEGSGTHAESQAFESETHAGSEDTGSCSTGDALETLKSTLLAASAEGVLVRELELRDESWRLRWEDDSELLIPRTLVSAMLQVPESWSLVVEYCDGTVASVGAWGSDLDLTRERIELDPFGATPLAARIRVSTPVQGRFSVRVVGLDGPGSDVVAPLSPMAHSHELTLLGLYPDHDNVVELAFTSATGVPRWSRTFEVTTAALGDEFPQFVIETSYPTPTPPNLGFMVEYRPLHHPIFVDVFGRVRYVYVDEPLPKWGLQETPDGNLLYGLGGTSFVHEVSWLGEIVRTWSVAPGFGGIHHDVFQRASGNLLVPVSEPGVTTVLDVVVELDRESGEVVEVWDLKDSMQTDRYVLVQDSTDWVHVNAVIEDPTDDTIIVSSQRHGLVKLTRDNTVVWILSAPVGWNEAFAPHLLSLAPGTQPVWGQHAPLLRSNGNLLVFDNGVDPAATAPYASRIVEFEIDPRPGGGGQARQVFEWGRDRPDLFSPLVSDVDHDEDGDLRLTVSGALTASLDHGVNGSLPVWDHSEPVKASIVEVDAHGQVRFEMLVHSRASGPGSVYRAEKLRLAP